MSDPHNLLRFIDAQDGVFETALAELREGRKSSHWMWYIFPQIAGLGRSATALFYAIGSRAEAAAYLHHPILGPRLRQTVAALLPWRDRRSAGEILGPVDAMKLRSSLTLFDAIEPDGIFREALGGFFDRADDRTLALLRQSE